MSEFAPLPLRYRPPTVSERIALIAGSYQRLLGRALVSDADDIAMTMWNAPAVVVAHGTEADPLLFFANRAALDAFETRLDSIIGMPSRMTAEPLHRDERAALLKRVTDRGFIEDYAGIRVSAKGRRFRIEQAVVWNLIDVDGRCHGQAATFAQWTSI
jgi:hypothetical protein